MKEQVTKFNLEAAFKALNEIEIPQVGGVKPNKDNQKELRESMRPTPKTDCLLEDYYDISSQEDLEVAKTDRQEEVAQAKLAKIEKIVDLDADSPEDLQPTYVGKTIIQCPQCMTLFYKNPEDINVSEDDTTLVNVGEQCPNCNNNSGYTVIGKVAAEEPREEENVEEQPAEEADLELNFEEPAEEPAEETSEEVPTEENSEEEINLEPVEEPAEEEKPEEEEKKEESFEAHSGKILAEQVAEALNEDTAKVKLSAKDLPGVLLDEKEWILVDQAKVNLAKKLDRQAANTFDKLPENKAKNTSPIDIFDTLAQKAGLNYEFDSAYLKEDINSDELSKKLKEHDEYIKVLQDEIKAEEEAIKNAKNDFIKKMHEKNLEALKDALDKAIPEEVKAEAAIDELPTAEDAAKDMTKNESLTESEDFETEFINDACYYLFHDPHYYELFDDRTKDADKIIKIYNEKHPKDIVNKKENSNSVILFTDKCKEKFESLHEEDEKFPNPDKHELVDTVDGIEIYHCKNCGKFGAKINDKVVKKDSVEEIKDCINGNCKESLVEEKCEICGKDVEEPCKSEKECKNCENKLDEDVIAKDAPEKADDIEQEQRKVSEIHKGKEEHVPGSIVEESLNEAADVKAELDAFIAGLDEGIQEEINEELPGNIPAFGKEAEDKIKALDKEFEEELTEAAPETVNDPAEFEAPKANRASFKSMLNDPVFKAFGESVEEEKLKEDLPAEIKTAEVEAQNELDNLAREFDNEPEIEELNDSYINNTISSYLTEVYSNVHNFEVTSCSMKNDKLIIEGIINFNSGKTKDTTFEFTKTAKNVYEGINKDLAGDDKFILECFTEDGGKMLMAEKLIYKYHIGNNLVEGLVTTSD